MMLTWHHLARSDLIALAEDRISAATVRRLRAGELSKHRLLLEVVRRDAARDCSGDVAAGLRAAFDLLAEVEGHAPEIVAELLALPQLGGWAVDCLDRLHGGDGDSLALHTDLSYVAGLAAVAALRAGRPFEIEVPLRHGTLILPTRGTARLATDDPRGSVLIGPASVPPLSPVPRLRVETDGLVLDVALEDRDPFLDRHGIPVRAVAAADLDRWRERLDGAWRILVRHHRALAEAMAVGLVTLVPLEEVVPGGGVGSTSGWSFGAIALSLPHDELSLARTLVHEFHHVVLGAVMDLVRLVDHGDHARADGEPGGGALGYAPWRADPRPCEGLLQGCYAYLGVTGFWRKQRHVGAQDRRMRGHIEFARWRRATLEPLDALLAAGELSAAGREFVTAMRDRLVSWQADPVPTRAVRQAADLATEHRTRWRLRHIRLAVDAVDELAAAWLNGVPARGEVPARVDPEPAPTADLPPGVASGEQPELVAAVHERLCELADTPVDIEPLRAWLADVLVVVTPGPGDRARELSTSSVRC